MSQLVKTKVLEGLACTGGGGRSLFIYLSVFHFRFQSESTLLQLFCRMLQRCFEATEMFTGGRNVSRLANDT